MIQEKHARLKRIQETHHARRGSVQRIPRTVRIPTVRIPTVVWRASKVNR